ncbi:MAG: hypothetical protein J5753_05075 [Oscillospiraceae bacterium]|nr:hypothetical protein [Oscillospiraceae bacterium]
MKIEPRKTAAMPKYALVLAAAAVMMTGCGLEGEAKTDDNYVIPETQQTTELEIDGFLDVRPDETEPVTEESDEIPLTDAFANNSVEALTDGFFDQTGVVLGVPGWMGENAEFAGEPQKVWLMNDCHKTMVCLYEAGSGMEERLLANGAEQFDWGFAGVTKYPRCVIEQDALPEEEQETDPEELEFRRMEQQEDYRTAFIAVFPDGADALTEEEAEQIARDLLGDTAETEVQEDEN